MLSLQTVLPNTLELLEKLAVQPLLSNMRLVGGTALALQYGHRRDLMRYFTARHATCKPMALHCKPTGLALQAL